MEHTIAIVGSFCVLDCIHCGPPHKSFCQPRCRVRVFMFGIVYFFSVATIYTGSSELYSDMWVRILLYIDMAITLCDPELLGYVTKTCFAKSWENPLPHQLF